MIDDDDLIGEIMLKVKDGEELTDAEVQNIVDSPDIEDVDTIEGDISGYTRIMTTIFKLGDKYYSLIWYEGLTEYQSTTYYAQTAIEVEKHEEQITVTRWVPKND